MRKRTLRKQIYVCMLSLLFLVGGCMFRSGEELYTLPQAPEEYLDLRDQLNQVISSGAEYAAPLSGANTQTVQMVDLDGDGTGEAVAFFRETGSERRSLKIYIFRQTEKGFETACMLEGEGAAISSISYADLTGDDWSELVVSWQMSAKVQSMSVYSIKAFEAEQMMQTEFTRYAMVDLSQSGRTEIVAFHLDTGGTAGARADYYMYRDNAFAQVDSAGMSLGVEEIEQIKSGLLYDGTPALFVDSRLPTGELVTDIFAIVDDVFQNVTAEEKTGVSDTTRRYYDVHCGDLDDDGYLEVPSPEHLGADTEETSIGSNGPVTNWIIHWNLYESDGNARRLMTTYHNQIDGWYLCLPQEWVKQGLFVSRQDTVPGERAVIFSIDTGRADVQRRETEEEYLPFLQISKLTGANRQERAKLGNRVFLRRDSSSADTLYVAEFLNETQIRAYHLESEAVLNNFYLIQADWSAEL